MRASPKAKRIIEGIEVINFTKRTIKVINLYDEVVIFDEKTGIYRVLPAKKPNYDKDGTKKEEK